MTPRPESTEDVEARLEEIREAAEAIPDGRWTSSDVLSLLDLVDRLKAENERLSLESRLTHETAAALREVLGIGDRESVTLEIGEVVEERARLRKAMEIPAPAEDGFIEAFDDLVKLGILVQVARRR